MRSPDSQVEISMQIVSCQPFHNCPHQDGFVSRLFSTSLFSHLTSYWTVLCGSCHAKYFSAFPVQTLYPSKLLVCLFRWTNFSLANICGYFWGFSVFWNIMCAIMFLKLVRFFSSFKIWDVAPDFTMNNSLCLSFYFHHKSSQYHLICPFKFLLKLPYLIWIFFRFLCLEYLVSSSLNWKTLAVIFPL